MSNYVIRGGEQGRARLGILAGALHPTTLELFAAAGCGPDMSCLDVGCGGGDVAMEMARLVGAGGRVVGVDIDPAKLEMARREAEEEGLAHLELREQSVADLSDDGEHDLVYARFLLTHLRDPASALDAMVRAARPGGTVVIEDIDHSGIFCHPVCPAVDRYVELYNGVVRLRGGDPEIGPKLPAMLRTAGLRDVRVKVVQPVFMEGEAKRMHRITLENIADAVVATGLARAEEIAATAAEIDAFTSRPDTLVSLPRIFQVWGVRE